MLPNHPHHDVRQPSHPRHDQGVIVIIIIISLLLLFIISFLIIILILIMTRESHLAANPGAVVGEDAYTEYAKVRLLPSFC